MRNETKTAGNPQKTGKTPPQKTRDAANGARIKRVVEITGYSKSMVKQVLAGDRKNAVIMATYLELNEGENLLMKAVREAVPFDTDKELVVSYQ